MRILVLIAGLALAASALAEDKPKVPVKQLDKSSPLLMSTEIPGDSADATDAKEQHNRSKSRAQDYNSSRSNTTSLRGGSQADASDFGLSRASERNKGQQGTQASDGADYNSSRSNKTHAPSRAQGSNRGLGEENRCSMRSLDCDDDGDSIPTTATCGNGVDDDCDGIADDAPANHNTTRSNRTQPAYQDPGDPVTRKRPGRD